MDEMTDKDPSSWRERRVSHRPSQGNPVPPAERVATERGRSLGLGFASVAETYDLIRPGYPDQLFEDILAYSGLNRLPSVLEVGCGTGKDFGGRIVRPLVVKLALGRKPR